MRDSVTSSFPVYYLVGDFQNPAYGRVSCNSYFQAILDNDDFSPGSDIKYDSMVLVLDPLYSFGAPDGLIKIGIHRLKENLNVETIYHTFDKAEYDKTPMATESFTAQELLNKRLRIHLDDLGQELAQKNREQSFASEFFTDNSRFTDYFKGFALITEFGENAILGFSPEISSNSSQTGLYFYYNFILDPNTPDADTIYASYKFGINLEGAGFNQIISERPEQLSTLKSAGELVSSTETMNQGFIQAGSGVLTELQIPNILDFKERYNNVIVNRAEIVIPSIENDIQYYEPPETIFMFRSNENQRILPFEQGAFGEIGIALKSNDQYLIDITDYFQALIEGREEESGYIFIPTLNGSTVNQFIFNGPKSDAEPIKLLVYYIPIN